MPGRTIAIGDIHGCSMLFAQLLDGLQLKADDTIVLLGDYVDRGPDVKNTLNIILELKKAHTTICLYGNHDLWMLKAREAKNEASSWLQVGGVQTLGSYGKSPGRSGKLTDVPEAHWDFLERGCVNYHETDTHIFVHANVEPNTPMNEQESLWLFWESITGPVQHMSGKTVVCGHTSQKNGNILDLGSIICIDTYAYGGGNLTAFDVDSRQFWQADFLGRVTTGTLPV
ncbi:metallophosphoesterase family protein [soil metagenome]